MQTLKKKKKKSFGPEVARVYTPAERSHMLDKILWFGGLWKHPNSSACIKVSGVFGMFKLDSIRKKTKRC